MTAATLIATRATHPLPTLLCLLLSFVATFFLFFRPRRNKTSCWQPCSPCVPQNHVQNGDDHGDRPFCFDPVSDLHADVATICLSFLDVRSLLGVAQHVNHAWRNAIRGGLRALWRDVCLQGIVMDDARLSVLIQRIHDTVSLVGFDQYTSNANSNWYHYLSSSLANYLVAPFPYLLSLRVLEVKLPHPGFADLLLRRTPLLEQLSLSFATDISLPDLTLPPLLSLTSLQCRNVSVLKGMHQRNLPSLSKLTLSDCSVDDASESWPITLREISIFQHREYNPQVLERIASLQQLESIQTDWSFVYAPHASPPITLFTSPYNQLSFLSTFSTLQQLSFVSCSSFQLRFPYKVVINSLCGLSSLRKLELITKEYDYASREDLDLICIAQLTRLEELTINHARRALDNDVFRSICTLPNLAILSLENCESITDHTPIAMCSSLRHLTINHSDDISCHKLSLKEIAAISRLQQLETLHLRCGLFFSGYLCFFCKMLHNLRDLYLFSSGAGQGYHESDFDDLPALPLLESLCIEVTSWRDLRFDRLLQTIVKIPSLKRVGFPALLSEEEEARMREALPRLENIFHCTVTRY